MEGRKDEGDGSVGGKGEGRGGGKGRREKGIRAAVAEKEGSERVPRSPGVVLEGSGSESGVERMNVGAREPRRRKGLAREMIPSRNTPRRRLPWQQIV